VYVLAVYARVKRKRFMRTVTSITVNWRVPSYA